jgi:hypothetical protein
MRAAVDGYENGGDDAVVAEIKSAPDTRINDVKVHTVDGIDVLIATEEMCGSGITGGAQSDASINKGCPLQAGGGTGVCQRNNENSNAQGADLQHGNGGISLYDVTDPTNPKPLEKNFYDVRGVHNTYAWTHNGGSYLIGVGGTEQFLDTFIVDISNPKSPTLLAQTGVLDWLDDGFSLAQLETGTFGSISLHDVWVEDIYGVPTAVLSYWDGGFITLDLSDPANPVFIGDSDYPDPDPLLGDYEGNAHAAVFGGENGEYIFAGDEDFDAFERAFQFNGLQYPSGAALFGPVGAPTGPVVWTAGEGCTPGEVPAATEAGQIALIQRGSCFFQDKAESAEAQGYAGYIVANDAARGDATINMSARDDAPVGIPGVFVGHSTGEIMKAASPTGLAEGIVSTFNGWGYLHVLETAGLGEVGYYAPAETIEAQYATGFGDLTMHNLEADPLTAGITPSFTEGPRMFVSWYSLGMRAVEYRPGHFHDNSNGEGSYSENVHEVGRFIADEGSNFWGVHVDELDGQQVILGSDRNTGLWIFTFSCETRLDDGTSVFYCDPSTEPPVPEDP